MNSAAANADCAAGAAKETTIARAITKASFLKKLFIIFSGEVMNVTLGTPENKSITEHTLKIGEEIDLNFYGVKDWSTRSYQQ